MNRIEELITCDLISCARLGNALNDLGYNGKLGIGLQFERCFIKTGFLEKWSDGMLKLRAEFTSIKIKIYDANDDGCQDVGAVLEK